MVYGQYVFDNPVSVHAVREGILSEAEYNPAESATVRVSPGLSIDYLVWGDPSKGSPHSGLVDATSTEGVIFELGGSFPLSPIGSIEACRAAYSKDQHSFPQISVRVKNSWITSQMVEKVMTALGGKPTRS